MSEDEFFREIQKEFLVEASENLAQTESLFISLERKGVDHTETLNQLKRLAHNFKGSGKAVGFDELSSFSHTLENLLIAISTNVIGLTAEVVDLLLKCNDALKYDLAALKNDLGAKLDHTDLTASLVAATSGSLSKAADSEAPTIDAEIVSLARPGNALAVPMEKSKAAEVATDNYIRIPMKKIDDLLNSFGEQVIFLSALDLYKDSLMTHQEEVVRTIFNLKKIAFDLQQSTLSLRMVNLKTLFSKLERVVRDSSRMTGKNVTCEVIGADSELDKAIVEQLSDPLTHMVRNAVDHGIEDSAVRVAAGKNEVGKIEIKASREGANFIIEIKDDGKGLDPVKIRNKAVEKKLIQETTQLSQREIFDLIFESDFSTKEQVSELSGRGVGMNVVKQMIQAAKGTYEIESEVGKGTNFKIKLPLSLSLYNAIAMNINNEKYIVPCSQIKEIVQSNEVEFRELKKNKQVICLRNELYEYYDLGKTLKVHSGQGKPEEKPLVMLICQFDGRRMAFGVQKVLGIHRVVQKSLSSEMKTCPGAAGVTVMGDGMPAIILDLSLLTSLYKPILNEAAA